MEQTQHTPPSAPPVAGDGLSIRRFFTSPGRHPFDTVEWELRDARIGHGATESSRCVTPTLSERRTVVMRAGL